jgi:hypothetical protein
LSDGQFVALDGDKVVGATPQCAWTSTFNHVDHTFADIIQGGWLTSHQPDGAWLYGADLSVSRNIADAVSRARSMPRGRN